jgi:PAS domain S-box-containing protein
MGIVALSPDTVREALLREYGAALLAFVRGAGEAALTRAYEIGRRAGNAHISLLDVVNLHEQAVGALVADGVIDGSSPHPGQFLKEALSPYEMTLRAYRDNARLLGLGRAEARQNAEVDRAQEQLRTILDATTAIIYLRDTAGRFLFVNRQFELVFPASPDDTTGGRAAHRPPDGVDEILRAGDELALAARESQEIEETFSGPDGARTYLSLKVPLLDDDGDAYAVCSVSTDISERKRAAEAIRLARDAADDANQRLRAAQAQLIQSAKMASLGQLVAGIAHEINNPLAFALSHLATARKTLGNIERTAGSTFEPGMRQDWDRASTRLREMTLGLERIRDLVVKLRVFSHLDEGELKRASVRDGVESVLMILGHRLKDRIAVETEFGLPESVECYPLLLNQAILNVLANAIDAIAGAGKITIRTGASAHGYDISVTDTGPGIPAELRERVFEPFFTTKAPGDGTGLGLSITYSIVRKHGGALVLECPEGGGTMVTVRLPLTAGPEP